LLASKDHIDIRVLEAQRVYVWQLKQPLDLKLEGHLALAAESFLTMFHSEVGFLLNHYSDNFLEILVLALKAREHLYHLLNVVLVQELSLGACHIIDVPALAARYQVHGLDTKGLVRCTLGSAAHLVELIVQCELAFIVHLNLVLEVVRVNILTVEKAKDGLDCLLRIAHFSFFVGHAKTISVERGQ